MNLSDDQKKALLFIAKTGSAHEGRLMQGMFPGPGFVKKEIDQEANAKYWEHDGLCYGYDRQDMVQCRTIAKAADYSDTYASKQAQAAIELRKAGLINTTNNGYNSYTHHITAAGKVAANQLAQ